MNLPIAPGSYGIDGVHSQLGFAVKHLGISSVRGTFDRFNGTLAVGPDLAGTVVTIGAEMASINSGSTMRDEHVHGAEFLDVANHPNMVFRSTSITESGSSYEMVGELTIKGTTLPATFQVAYNGSATFPMDQSTHYGFSASGTISRSAYGVSYGVPMVSDEVGLTLDVQFIEPAGGA